MAQTTVPTYSGDAYLGEDPNLNRLFDNVQTQTTGALLSVVKMVCWNTIEDFYIRSTWQREWVDFCLPPGVPEIDFNPFNGDWLAQWILDFWGLPYGQVRRPAVLMDLQCPPVSGDRRGKVLLALKPVSFNAEFDPDLFSTWFETIVDGALGRLYMQPAKPYTNQQLGMMKMKLSRSGIQRARATAQLGYTSGPGRWAYPAFAHGRAKN